MNLYIQHYEPGEDEPYEVETIEDVSSFEYDTAERSLIVNQSNGGGDWYYFNHRVVITTRNPA